MCNRISLLVESYLSYKHRLGFHLTQEALYLRSFAQYTEEINYNGSLSRTIVFQWCERGDSPSLVTKGRRYEPFVAFSAYAVAFDEESEQLPRCPYGNPHRRKRPHIYTPEETYLLMEQCSYLHAPDGLRALTVRTAIGLLWATGMRTSELIGLTPPDVDCTNDLIMIRSSKFNRDRIIPVLPVVSEHLSEYRSQIKEIVTASAFQSSFFLTTGGKPLNRSAFEYAFRIIRSVVDASDSEYGHARLYDFRHTFATRTIRNWLKNGVDANSRLFLLSTYMGHIHAEDTYWYLSATPELLDLSSGLYEKQFGGDGDG